MTHVSPGETCAHKVVLSVVLIHIYQGASEAKTALQNNANMKSAANLDFILSPLLKTRTVAFVNPLLAFVYSKSTRSRNSLYAHPLPVCSVSRITLTTLSVSLAKSCECSSARRAIRSERAMLVIYPKVICSVYTANLNSVLL